MSRYAISRRVASGAWVAVLPGVYRLAGAPETWHQRLKAACLWAGEGAAVSHRAAAALAGLEGFAKDCVEISTPAPHSHPPPWLRCHRVASLPPGHVVERFGIPMTSADRTLVDLAGTIPERQLERMLDEILRKGLASRLRIAWTVRHSRSPGRAVLRRLLDVRLPGYVPPDGELEAAFARLVKEEGLPEPVRQVQIEDGKRNGRVDFLWQEFGVAVETDGFRWHATREGFVRDRWKRNLLTRRRLHVLQVTWEDVTEERQELVACLRDLLRPAPGAENGPA